MAFDYNLWDSQFQDDGTSDIDLGDDFLDEDKPTKSSSTSDFYYGQRGVLGDAGSLLARGFASTLETLENAAEFFGAGFLDRKPILDARGGRASHIVAHLVGDQR